MGKPVSVGVQPDDQPDVREAKVTLITAFRREANEEAERALANIDQEPEEWRDATLFGRYRIRVDAEELAQLNREIGKLIEPFVVQRRM